MIKAIETRYAGCRFRSRLEARWAVFFDQLEIEWQYEPQGFESPSGNRYLPDFYLPKLRNGIHRGLNLPNGIYAEVKGATSAVTAYQRETLAELIDYGGPLARGVLLLGPVPRVDTPTTGVAHTLLCNRKGVDGTLIEFNAHAGRWPLDGIRESGLSWWEWGDVASSPDLPVCTQWEAHPYCVQYTDGRGYYPMRPEVAAAYTAARSARFEHGESGA